MFLDKLKTLFSSDELFPAPRGDLMSINRMKEKASSYSLKYDQSDDLADLDAALQYNKAVVDAARSSGHPSLASFLETLSNFHDNRFIKNGDRTDLNEAIQHMKAAVEATSAGDPDLPRRYSGLGRSYALLFRELDDLDALELAFKYQRLALDDTPESDPARLERMTDLSVSYSDRFQRLGDRKDLDESLKYDLAVVAAVASDDPELPRYQQSLAASYGAYFDTFGELTALESALHWNKLAVASTSPKDSDLPFRQVCLAVLLTRYFDKVGKSEDIQSAIRLCSLALDATPIKSSAHLHRQTILALAYSALYHRYGDLKDLEETIKLEQDVVDATPPDHPKLSVYQFNLATSHTAQFRRLGDIKDLELALKWNKAALEKVPLDHPTLSSYQRSLALAYVDRFERQEDVKDIDLAMKYMKAALDGTPADQPFSRSECLQSLAICHKIRFDVQGQLEDVDIAIELLKEVLETRSNDDIHTALFYLGVLYLEHFAIQQDIPSLESSLVYGLKAVEAISTGHPNFSIYHYNLAVAYRNKFRQLHNQEDLQNALAHFHKATESSNSPSTVWDTAKFWGRVAYEYDLSECLDAYTIAFKNLSQLIWIGNSISVRHTALEEYNIPEVAGAAAVAAIKFGKLEMAVEFLDQGLAVTYRQLLELREESSAVTELEKQHPKLTGRFTEISQYLQQLEADSLRGAYDEKMKRSYHALAIERNDLIKEIQQLKGFENIFMPPSFKKLSAAAQYGPVIMINCTQIRSDAIMILPSFPYVKVVSLPQVTPEAADKTLKKLRKALEFAKIQSRSPDLPDRHAGRFRPALMDSQKLFRESVSWLSTAVVDLVFQALRESDIHSGRIWWCPSGAFTYLPLHAAGIDSPFLQSYTSTLDALIQARNRKPLASNAPGALITALGVNTLPNQPHLSLPSVAKELSTITSIIGEERILSLRDTEAGVDQVLNHIQKATWLHLACHGEQHPTNPLESGLLLQDGRLQLSQILAKNLPSAQLVFLSACQTAMGDSGLVNESMHLAGGFIAAGFQGAVGTLWSIADADGPVVAEIFYKRIFGGGRVPDVTSAAEALCMAVKHLKASGAPFERWMPFVHFGV